jgi:hypothetical protein
MADLPSALKKNRGAFTLIEAIVSAAIAAVVGVVLITLLLLNNRAVTDGALNSKNQIICEAVADQIGYTTRQANKVLADNETWSSSAHGANVSVTAIFIYDKFGTVTGGYKVDGTSLKEWIGGAWQNFRVGTDNVKVVNTSTFGLSEDRKSLTLNLSVISTFFTTSDTALSKQERYLCRN